MNRYDAIKGAALDVAQHLTQDPKQRDAMACDLITLIGLMISAVGKGVAVDGEADRNHARTASFPWDNGSFDPSPETVAEAMAERAIDEANGYTRYLTGEAMQAKAEEVAGESRTADLSRYATSVWHPRCGRCAERGSHDRDCDALCTECNRVLQFGHLLGCSQREPLPSRVVAATFSRCVGCGDGDCDGSCCISL